MGFWRYQVQSRAERPDLLPLWSSPSQWMAPLSFHLLRPPKHLEAWALFIYQIHTCSIRKAGWLCLEIHFEPAHWAALLLLPFWSTPPSSLVWIVPIPSQLISLLLALSPLRLFSRKKPEPSYEAKDRAVTPLLKAHSDLLSRTEQSPVLTKSSKATARVATLLL